MDKNSIVGILLIFGILVVFSIMNQPSKEEIEAAKHRQDSIAQVELKKQLQQELELKAAKTNEAKALPADTAAAKEAIIKELKNQFGVFGKASLGEEEFYTVENNLIKIKFTNKGGRIYSVELKNYQTHDSLPLILFDGEKTKFGLNFFAQNRSIQTEHLYFTPEFSAKDILVSGPNVKKGDEGKEKVNKENPGESKTVSFKLQVAPDKFIEYIYTVNYNSYMVGFDIRVVGMNNLIPSNMPYLNFVWAYDVPRQEAISQFGEDRYTNIHFKFYEGDVEDLSQGKSDKEDLSTRTKWIAFKQLFFNSTIIADDYFPIAEVRSDMFKDDPKYLANFTADISIPYDGKGKDNFGMKFYFGPNHYQTLEQYKIGLESLVYLGYAIVRPVNKYLIIPVFNFLRDYISNFGIIILLLTIFIKTLVFPFTYKSYISQAKMKALKPEIDEITKKYGKDKAMEKQQATMALYKKAGVNPMGGCLPMLFQFPFLIAMFFFFPTSIELRQQGFLWATDLSTYDSILSLPFTIPFYGDHVSGFCLLMTATTIISTRLNSQTTASQGMPGMKVMMYMMPIFFLFLLNNYSSGLSYYYFLANVITIGQTYIIRHFVDDDKIRAQILVNKKKPVKRSNFQKRLETMAKQRGGHKSGK